MKILVISDEEAPGLWDYYTPGKLKKYDLILSCGDLKAEYLRFLVTMARCPLLYIHGNHDEHYQVDPPEGCDCIDDGLVIYNGLRILGLGGCKKYRSGDYHFTERQMRFRIFRLKRKLKLTEGVDLVLSHAPPEGLGDLKDHAHRGFSAFRKLMDTVPPRYWLHGHIHLYHGMQRIIEHGSTTVINCCGTYELELPEGNFPAHQRNRLVWITPEPKFEPGWPDKPPER